MVRSAYRMLLRLHPQAFRERFADEMLWVFDEMTAVERRSVLRDGALSVVTQWMATDTVPRAAVPFGVMPTSSMNALRLAQATTVAALLTLGFFKLLTQTVPLPQPTKDFAVRRAAWALCSAHTREELRVNRYRASDCTALK